MSAPAIAEAADLLADLRRRTGGQAAPIDDLPESCRPGDLDTGYEIQDLLRDRLTERGHGPPVGWKIGCTTPVMQEYLQISHPCAGTLYRPTVYSGAATLRCADFFSLGLECEIAVRLAADLPGRPGGHDVQSVRAAVSAVMTSVEIVELRFRDFLKAATPSLIADDFFSCGAVLGAPAAVEDLGDLATLAGGFEIDGTGGDRGTGAVILGHPLAALAWLADHMAARGGALKAGEVVTLGSVVRTFYPEPGMAIAARFDSLPPVTLSIL